MTQQIYTFFSSKNPLNANKGIENNINPQYQRMEEWRFLWTSYKAGLHGLIKWRERAKH